MSSPVINGQISLDFEPGLSVTHRSLRECLATRIYKHGLGRVAIDLDQAPGNLSVQLSDDPARKFSVDAFERFLQTSGDMTPLYYLIDKFLHDPQQAKNAALAQLTSMAPELISMLKKAGLAT